MNASDWKQLQRIVESPDPQLLKRILSAKSHDAAHAQAEGWGRAVVRAVRRLATDLRGAEIATSETERDEALQAVAELQQEVKRCATENEEFRALLEIADHCASAARVVLPQVKRAKGEHAATSHALLSDIHAGLGISPESVLGLNEYNLEICKARLARYARNVLRLVDRDRKSRQTKQLVIWMLGDFIHNELHGGDAATACVLGAPEASVWITSVLVSMIHSMLPSLDEWGIELVLGLLPGNHDRVTIRLESGRAMQTSYVRPIAYGLQVQLPKRVTIHAPDAQQLILTGPDGVSIRGMHGTAFRYISGIGGPEVPIRKAIIRLNRGIPADILVNGHLHTAITPGDFLQNGSVCGTSAFSHDGAMEHRKPEQIYFQTDSHYGLSTINRIHLGE